MEILTTSCSKMFDLVHQLCELVPGDPPPDIVPVRASEMPDPYRALLVHKSDMTSRLTEFHGEPIVLEELGRVVTPAWLARRSLLRSAHSRQPVEYGLIRIYLPVLEESVRAGVLEGCVPLGALLNASGMFYRSCPGGFFQVAAEGAVTRALAIGAPTWLYGRCNCLSDRLGRAIADVVEILPPDPAAPCTRPGPRGGAPCRQALEDGRPCCGRLDTDR